MSRRTQTRLSLIADTLRAKSTKRFEEEKKHISRLAHFARHHAVNVAAIVLAGEPKIDEPLNRAWIGP